MHRVYIVRSDNEERMVGEMAGEMDLVSANESDRKRGGGEAAEPTRRARRSCMNVSAGVALRRSHMSRRAN